MAIPRRRMAALSHPPGSTIRRRPSGTRRSAPRLRFQGLEQGSTVHRAATPYRRRQGAPMKNARRMLGRASSRTLWPFWGSSLPITINTGSSVPNPRLCLRFEDDVCPGQNLCKSLSVMNYCDFFFREGLFVHQIAFVGVRKRQHSG